MCHTPDKNTCDRLHNTYALWNWRITMGVFFYLCSADAKFLHKVDCSGVPCRLGPDLGCEIAYLYLWSMRAAELIMLRCAQWRAQESLARSVQPRANEVPGSSSGTCHTSTVCSASSITSASCKRCAMPASGRSRTRYSQRPQYTSSPSPL